MASDLNVVDEESEYVIHIHSDNEDQVEDFQLQLELLTNEGDFEHEIDLNTAPTEHQPHGIDLNIPAEEVEEGDEVGGFDLNLPPSNEHESTSHHQHRLSNYERLKILCWLLDRQHNGKLIHGSINTPSQHFQVSRQTISKLWNTAKR
ncbi:33 kDa chaperonin [Bienertia sinuspersici]